MEVSPVKGRRKRKKSKQYATNDLSSELDIELKETDLHLNDTQHT